MFRYGYDGGPLKLRLTEARAATPPVPTGTGAALYRLPAAAEPQALGSDCLIAAVLVEPMLGSRGWIQATPEVPLPRCERPCCSTWHVFFLSTRS